MDFLATSWQLLEDLSVKGCNLGGEDHFSDLYEEKMVKGTSQAEGKRQKLRTVENCVASSSTSSCSLSDSSSVADVLVAGKT